MREDSTRHTHSQHTAEEAPKAVCERIFRPCMRLAACWGKPVTWTRHAQHVSLLCTNVSGGLGSCHVSATRNLGTKASAIRQSTTSRNVWRLQQMNAMLLFSTTRHLPGRHAWKQMRGFRSVCSATINRALTDSHRSQAGTSSNLDVTVLPRGALSHILDTYSHFATLDLDPDQFLPQTRLPLLAGIFVDPHFAPLHVAHRRIGARTQSRVEVPNGGCMLRGESSRREWTLAIPPLLRGSSPNDEQLAQPPAQRRTRRIVLLVDQTTSAAQARDILDALAFVTHQPRSL